MRIVVTGVAGFIGSHVAEALLAEGHDVVGIDAFIDYYHRSIKERNLTVARGFPTFRLHELDLRTDPLDEVLEGADAVIHEAAMPGLPLSWTRFDSYVSCNVNAVQRLLEGCRVAGVHRYLHISTSSVYGAVAMGDETSPTLPTSPYGVTKLAGEQLVQAYGRTFDFPAVILRYFSIYGPRQRPDMAYNIFIKALLEGRQINVFGDGTRSRTSTYISDCVRGTLQALHGAVDGQVYNIGGGEAITVSGVLDLLCELTGRQVDVRYAPPRPGDQEHTRAVVDKARARFGYAPRVSLREGLAQQVDWQQTVGATGSLIAHGPTGGGATPGLATPTGAAVAREG